MFVGTGAPCPLLAASSASNAEAKSGAFKLRYVLSTNLCGTLPIADIVPEVHAAGCEGLDVWAGCWGNQREQIDALEQDAFAAMPKERAVGFATYTCMDPGFMKSEPHMRAMRRFGGDTIVAGFGDGGRKTRCCCANSAAISAGEILDYYAWRRGDGSSDLSPPPQKNNSLALARSISRPCSRRSNVQAVVLLTEFQRLEQTGGDASALLKDGEKAELLKKKP